MILSRVNGGRGGRGGLNGHNLHICSSGYTALIAKYIQE